ncbi:MAG: hypothetical protein V4472_10795 [Pseudomonadota bacterium]
MNTQYSSHSRPLSEVGLKAELLLGRYPSISERELDDLIDLFPRLPILDLALMTTDDRISAKVAEFHQAHRARLKTPKAALIVLIGIFLLVPAVTVALAWPG